MHLAHKIELKLNNKQVSYFKKACGISRFVWNWAIEEWNKTYKQGGKPNALELKKKFNAIKKERYPYVLEVTKYAAQQPFIQLQEAYNRFFKGTSSHPKFKSRKRSKDSFYIGGEQLKVNDNKVYIPKLGYVKMTESLRFTGKISSAAVSRTADRWHISFTIELTENPCRPCESQAGTGVDLGIEKLAVLSDGTVFENPKTLRRYLKRLRKLQRQLARAMKDSNNRQKKKIKLAKVHRKIHNIRLDSIHKATAYLTKNYKDIVIEDLNVKGMLKNHHIALSISDVSMYEFRRQLEYKSKLRGNNIIIADRWYPSSKMCSNCGYTNSSLKLSDRIYRCPQCGIVINRDLNASINLLNYGRASSARTYTPVERGSVDERGNEEFRLRSTLSLKQEPSSKPNLSRFA